MQCCDGCCWIAVVVVVQMRIGVYAVPTVGIAIQCDTFAQDFFLLLHRLRCHRAVLVRLLYEFVLLLCGLYCCMRLSLMSLY